LAVDVVVVDYHTPEYLYDFVDSYRRHFFDGCTLTIVHVEEEKGEAFARGAADVEIWFRDNAGYGRACNRGAAEGVNDVILLANADTRLSIGFEQCYRALMTKAKFAVLGPRQIDEYGRITSAGIVGGPKAPHPRGWQERDAGQYDFIDTEVDSVSGSLYFIKRSVWEELTDCEYTQEFSPGVEGAFLETPHYFEETTCSLHARAHGYKVVYYGPVQMEHFWHKASAIGGIADRHFNESQKMHRKFCELHGILCE
jgi:GT2 family glycosyltransferase